MIQPPEGPPPPSPPEDQAVERPDEPELRCWRCGSPHDRFQEYCLECGARLAPRVGPGWQREVWTRDGPFWFWAAFLGLLLIALIAGAIVLAATNDDDGEQRGGAGPTTSQLSEVPTNPPVTTSTLPPEITIPPTTATTPTTTPTTTAATTTTTGQTTTGSTTTTGNGDAIMSWPSGQSGYTIILTSVPASRGRAAADAEARRAIDRGLDEVGVLNSSNFSSLNSGYWVVFSGVYDGEGQARSDLPTVRQNGYPVAYIREITP